MFSEGKEKSCGFSLFCMKCTEGFFLHPWKYDPPNASLSCWTGGKEADEARKYRFLYSVCRQLDQLQQIA